MKRLHHTGVGAAKHLSWLLLTAVVGCGAPERETIPTLRWYVFDEPSGAFAQAAARCTDASQSRYRIVVETLPAAADQQREQLVRRLAAADRDIDLIGMDVIWTAEFAQAGWVLPWPAVHAARARDGRLGSTVASASYANRLWAIPFTSNAQLLWYRSDRVRAAPATWQEMIDMAEEIGGNGKIQAQGARYEGLTVLFVSLLASAGGAVLEPDGRSVSLQEDPTRRTLDIMQRFASSAATDPSLGTAHEDESRLAYEAGASSFMVNYTFVWPSARTHAPDIAEHTHWARWPAVTPGRPSRVTIGGINLGVSAHSRYPELAFEAAQCVASAANQSLAATLGGLPPTMERLFDDPAVRATFPFAEVLRDTLRDAVQRPQTPLYTDVSLAISHTLHPMRAIDPARDVERLRAAVGRALRSEGLL
jgi:multiple sugar transport system substrate-binding protein